jgi:hypothetical protein
MDPITVALKQEGVDEVKTALRDVQETIAALDSFSATSARRAGRDRVRAAKEEASERRRVRDSESPDRRSQRSRNDARSGFRRALGESNGSSFRRASSGPTVAEMSGGGAGLSSLIGKAGAAGAAFAVFKSAIDFASDALQQFGGFLISDVIKPAFALETAAQQLENAAGGQIKASDIESKTRAAGLKHNMDPMALFEAAGKMIDLTGDAKTSFDLLDTIGTLAKGRGADAEQLAEFAASLKNFDPNATSEQINKLLMTQLAQGDQGSVPLKEAARLGGRLTAPAAFLAGNTDVRMASMGALLQSGRKGFGSTDELMTGIGNLINEVTSQKMVGSKKYLNADGQIGDVASLIGGILKETGGDAKKIGALGLSDPASKLVKAYLPTFSDAGKGDKGKEAVESLIRGFMEASTSLDREKDNERKVLQTSGEKWTATIEGLKNKLLDVMPEVQKFVDQFAKIAPQFGGALVTLAKIMIKVANYLAGIFGEDETAVDTNAAGEAQGKYRMNLETGQFEWVKQSQLNKEAEADPFNPNFKGEGLKLKWDGVKTPSDTNAEGNATTAGGMSVNPTILSPLLPTGPAPTIAPLALPGLSSAPSASSGSSQSVDGALASLDALAPKAQKLGLMFDKLAVAGNDAARSKPLAQR